MLLCLFILTTRLNNACKCSRRFFCATRYTAAAGADDDDYDDDDNNEVVDTIIY